MSSVKEYWSRASETRSDIETTSSENYSFDDSLSCKECRDASCNVDFDDYETEIDEAYEADDVDESDVGKNFINNSFDELLYGSRIGKKKYVFIKSSRYVCWSVLMSLGIGLWAVLCIFDVFQSEESVTARDWLYELIWGKKNVSVVEEKTAETPISSDSNLLSPYLWKIATTTCSGAYILFVLFVFCIRSQKTQHEPSDSNQQQQQQQHTMLWKKNISIPKKMKSSSSRRIVEMKSSVFPNYWPRIEPTNYNKFLSIKLQQLPSEIYRQRKLIFCIEKRFMCDFRKFSKPAAVCSHLLQYETRVVPEILEDINKGNESSSLTCFTIKKLDDLDTNISTMNLFSNINQANWNSALKSPLPPLCALTSAESSKGSISIFGLEINEYMRRKRRKCWTERISLSNNNRHLRNRIITSSPVFKKFLLNFQQQNVSSHSVNHT